MSLSNSFWGWLTGEDLNAAEASANRNDALLASINQRDYAEGGAMWNMAFDAEFNRAIARNETPEQAMLSAYNYAERNYATVQANLTSSSGNASNASGQVFDSFQQGASEGLASEVSFVNSTLNTGVFSILKSIPPVVWLLAGVVLFVWLGGMNLLKRKVANA